MKKSMRNVLLAITFGVFLLSFSFVSATFGGQLKTGITDFYNSVLLKIT